MTSWSLSCLKIRSWTFTPAISQPFGNRLPLKGCKLSDTCNYVWGRHPSDPRITLEEDSRYRTCYLQQICRRQIDRQIEVEDSRYKAGIGGQVKERVKGICRHQGGELHIFTIYHKRWQLLNEQWMTSQKSFRIPDSTQCG